MTFILKVTGSGKGFCDNKVKNIVSTVKEVRDVTSFTDDHLPVGVDDDDVTRVKCHVHLSRA